METIFNRRSEFSVLCFFVCFWIAVYAFAQDKESVSAAVAAARKAGVPEETVSRILARGYEHDLEADEIVGFLDVTRTAQEKGFPLAPLMGKIEEGLAKQIEARNITRVLDQELARLQFTRQLVVKTKNSWKEKNMELRHDDLVRMAGTLAMGLSKSDMETFFSGVPQTSMNRIANALEFMAGLIQGGLSRDRAREVVYAGVESDFFSGPDWRLSTMVRVAVQKDIPNQWITAAALDVVRGKMGVPGALQRLDLDPTDLQRGPHLGGSDRATFGKYGHQGQYGNQGDDPGSGGPGQGSGGAGNGGSSGGNGAGGSGGGGGSHGGGSGGSSGGPGK